MAFIRRHINLLFVFILPVYFYIVQNTIQNKHTHVYANGVVVTHSHPVEGNEDIPINEHEHSKSEIRLYSSMHIDLYDMLISSAFLLELEQNHLEYSITDDDFFSAYAFHKTNTRGPPQNVFLM